MGRSRTMNERNEKYPNMPISIKVACYHKGPIPDNSLIRIKEFTSNPLTLNPSVYCFLLTNKLSYLLNKIMIVVSKVQLTVGRGGGHKIMMVVSKVQLKKIATYFRYLFVI